MKRESFLQVKWESVSQVEEILQLPFVSIQFPFSVSAEVWVIEPPPPTTSTWFLQRSHSYHTHILAVLGALRREPVETSSILDMFVVGVKEQPPDNTRSLGLPACRNIIK